jgi:predicted deacylase
LFIWQIVSAADYGIDLHTGAINRANLPQIRANLDDARTFELARAFGAPVIIDADVRDGSLRGCAAELGIPTLIYEAGEALRFDETSIRAGLRGIFNVMRAIGMLPEKSAAERQKRFVEPVVARSTRWVRAPESGIVHHRAKLGRRVEEGSRLATISDPIGRREDVILAPFDGIVIGRSNLPLAHEGDALFHLGSFRDVPKAEGVVETFAHAHEDKE